MPKFSQLSEEALQTCHEDLQELLRITIQYKNFSVLEGHRNKERQNDMHESGRSQLSWPDSKHNSEPSKAVDIVPYPVDWKNRERFYHLAGYIQGVAEMKGIGVRWGGDWDQDGDVCDNHFDDLGHFELTGE